MNQSLAAAQNVLALGHRESFRWQDFVVSGCNEMAYRLVAGEQESTPAQIMLLTGAAGCGKSHLAAIWMERTAAKRVIATDAAHNELIAGIIRDVSEAPAAGNAPAPANNATALADHSENCTLFDFAPERILAHQSTVTPPPPELTPPSLVIENTDRSVLDEHLMFELLNHALAHRLTIMATAREPVGAWDIHLPDLHSRWKLAQQYTIGLPDDYLLRAVIVKLFADRQLEISPRGVMFLLLGLERSIAAAYDAVEAIDRYAMENGGKVGSRVIKRALGW